MKNALLSLMLLLLAGCATGPGKLPSGAKVVGGGILISWQPPVDGTAILVEQNSGKIIATKNVNPRGTTFEFDPSVSSDERALRAALGGDIPMDTRFVLYFVPEPQR